MSLEESITNLIESNEDMAESMLGQAKFIESALQKQEQRIVVKEQQVDKFLQEATPEIRYEQTIHIGGSKDVLYPVWWDFPGNRSGVSNITICRNYADNADTHPLVPNDPHQAGLLLEIEGNSVGWGGDGKVFEIKRFSETYNQTASHPSFQMYSKAEKLPGVDKLYVGASTNFAAQSPINSGLYLRGGGLTYQIIKNWKGDVGYHDGSDNLRRQIGSGRQGDWGVVWYVEPIPFADILQPPKTVNAYLDPVL